MPPLHLNSTSIQITPPEFFSYPNTIYVGIHWSLRIVTRSWENDLIHIQILTYSVFPNSTFPLIQPSLSYKMVRLKIDQWMVNLVSFLCTGLLNTCDLCCTITLSAFILLCPSYLVNLHSTQIFKFRQMFK